MEKPVGSEIPVVFDHSDFVVINKPVGISVHDKDEHPGIVSLLKTQLGLSELWLVHRLDKVTSGCLLLAKNAPSAAALSAEFAARNVQKFYVALTDKKPKKRQGSVTGDLKKVRDGKWMLTRSEHNPSVTHFFDKGFENGLRLQVLKPYTGQTHQLRVVMSSLGATILGDSHYKGTASDRTYLHAWQLQFSLGAQALRFTCLPLQGEHFLRASFGKLLSTLSPVDETFNWPDSKLLRVARKDDS